MSIHHLANLDHARRHHDELIRRAADQRLGRSQRRQRRQRRQPLVTGLEPSLGCAPDG